MRTMRHTLFRCLVWIPLWTFGAGIQPARAQDPFADAVVDFTPGTNGGFGAALLPDIVLGPPRGAGLVQGSFDVLSLGSGGSITLRFDLPFICDGPGADLTVFENAFHSGTPSGPVFTEYGFVAVSQDGTTFFEFPYDAETGAGLAGQRPVLSHPDNGIDPLDPVLSGGDQFDLAEVGLTWARYVRITDVAGAIPDVGDLPQFSVAPNAGFDLDAVAALHACDPATVASPTPTRTARPTGVTATATAGAGETPAATHTPDGAAGTATATRSPASPSPSDTQTPGATAPLPTATHPPVFGDLDGDGAVTNADVLALIAELFRPGNDSSATPTADLNGDLRITAADLVRLMEERPR